MVCRVLQFLGSGCDEAISETETNVFGQYWHEKAETTSGSYEESKERPSNNNRAPSKQNEDSRYVDMQHFPEDCQSSTKRVNSGSNDAGSKERRPTTPTQTTHGKDNEGPVRNIAQNFSRDQASLHIHPTKNKIINNNNNAPEEEEECNDDNICLDTNNFPANLVPPSPNFAVSSNAVWRANSSAVKHTKYAHDVAQDNTLSLPDTPRAFTKNLNMLTLSKARVMTEADKFWSKML